MIKFNLRKQRCANQLQQKHCVLLFGYGLGGITHSAPHSAVMADVWARFRHGRCHGSFTYWSLEATLQQNMFCWPRDSYTLEITGAFEVEGQQPVVLFSINRHASDGLGTIRVTTPLFIPCLPDVASFASGWR